MRVLLISDLVERKETIPYFSDDDASWIITMNYIIGRPMRAAARKAAQVSKRYHPPVILTEDGDKPILCGESFRYETKGGQTIAYPNAYSRVGWSNMIYKPSSLSVNLPKSWAISYAKKTFNSVTLAGKTFYIKSKNTRETERLLSKYERHILAAPEDRRPVLFKAALFCLGKDEVVFGEAFEVKIPDTKKHTLALLGHKPVEIAKILGCELSVVEAKEWMNSDYICPSHWLFNQLKECCGRSAATIYGLRGTDVIRWVLAVVKDPKRQKALLRDRTIIGPHGEVLSFRYFDRLDEISEVDLAHGDKSGVQDTFERAAKRVAEEKLLILKASEAPLRKDPSWWPGDTSERRLLRSAADLVREGDLMQHCVAQYVGYVKAGKSLIVAITGHDGRRATAELNSAGEVEQFLAFGNSQPSDRCRLALDNLIVEIIFKRQENELRKTG